jgi:hypothetical protein
MPSLYNRVAGQSAERIAALSNGIFVVAGMHDREGHDFSRAMRMVKRNRLQPLSSDAR